MRLSMGLKLFCVKDFMFRPDYFSDETYLIKEGNTINAEVYNEGIRFEFEENTLSAPYDIRDVSQHFITAFDADNYNKIYRNVKDCRIYINDEEISIGDAVIKLTRV